MPIAPPAFVQLVGHPLRWQLLAELAESDRTVHELMGLAEQPQSLVSYHLGKLRGAGLVSARRSTADRRGAYYAADLTAISAQLRATGARLHPGLRLGPMPVDGPALPAGRRVLFLCTGNSARSQIAEALLHARSGGAIEALSAGSAPKPVHPNAVKVLREEHGIDISAQRSKHVDDVAGLAYDRVVTLCDRVREVCPSFDGAPATHWSTPDPAAAGLDDEASYPAFLALAAELDIRIGFLLATLTAPEEP